MKILKPIVVTLSAILVLLILATIIAPPVAKNYIIKHSKEMIGRQINIDAICQYFHRIQPHHGIRTPRYQRQRAFRQIRYPGGKSIPLPAIGQ
ncbi:hypothetical protein DXA95_08995 [Odoribacter sp. OF09-27XD]|nr:hypothetical protein DXA95_08995 [Odoribacter sp. OF09-27XD]